MSPGDPERKPASVPCAGAVIRDPAGRLLLVRRGHAPSADLWSVPGGRIEPGESPAEAAVREVREETGLEVAVDRLLATVQIGAYVVHDFAAHVVGGTLAAGDDAAEVRWCDVDELSLLPLTPGLLDELRGMGVL
jgi:mutator protein MutT